MWTHKPNYENADFVDPAPVSNQQPTDCNIGKPNSCMRSPFALSLMLESLFHYWAVLLLQGLKQVHAMVYPVFSRPCCIEALPYEGPLQKQCNMRGKAVISCTYESRSYEVM